MADSPTLSKTQPAPGPANHAAARTHLLDQLAVLHRHRHLALAIFVLAALAVVVRDYTAVQYFRATARILIEDERSTAIPGLAATEAAYYQDPEPYYQTQYKILKGRDLARQVARELQLDQLAEFGGAGQAPSASAPLASAPAAPADGSRVPRTDAGTDDRWAGYVDAFLDHVSVDPVRGSRLVDVSFTSVDPQFAATATNALVQTYVQIGRAHV